MYIFQMFYIAVTIIILFNLLKMLIEFNVFLGFKLNLNNYFNTEIEKNTVYLYEVFIGFKIILLIKH